MLWFFSWVQVKAMLVMATMFYQSLPHYVCHFLSQHERNDRNFTVTAQRNHLFCCVFPFFLLCSLFLFLTPTHKSKSRLGFNDGRSWSLRQSSVTAGGPSATCYPRCPHSPYCPAQFGTSPSLVWLRAAPKHRVCFLRATHPPSLVHAGVRSPTPICSLFMQGQSNPSSCCLNLHTKDQCKDHQLRVCRSRIYLKTIHPDPRVFRLNIIPSSLAL